MSSPTAIRLLTEDDWILWYNYVKSEAISHRIWKFVDPENANPPVNTPPDLEYYLRERTRPGGNQDPPAPGTTDPATGDSQTSNTSTQTLQPSQPIPGATTPAPGNLGNHMEQFLTTADVSGRFNAYKVANDEYNRTHKGITALKTLIHTTVGPNYQVFIDDKTDPREMLSILDKVAKPSEAQLYRNLEDEVNRLRQGPKRLGTEAWLQLHVSIAKKAERVVDPPTEATRKSLTRHFIRACQDLNPSIFSAYSLQSEMNTLDITLEDLIKEFRVSYQPPKRKGAFPTLSGEPSDPTDPKRQSVDRQHCPACGGGHTIDQCWNLFEELQPVGWVVNP
jgi:hypothetical protein